MDADPRAELERWQATRTANFYDATPNLARSLRARLGDEGLREIEPRLREFGAARPRKASASPPAPS